MPDLVSVIVPVYNGERFLLECLESLLVQDYPAIEVIVVDDGSSDGSADLAESLEGVRVLRRPHEGLASTRNAGVSASSGPLIGFCDCDDTWKPAKARTQVEYLTEHPECDVVLCRQDTVFDPGVSAPPWLIPDQVRGDLDGVSSTSGLFRREALERVGGFDTNISGVGVDFDLLVRVRAAGSEIALIEESLRTRRIHDDNMTTRLGTGIAAMFQTVREHVRRKP